MKGLMTAMRANGNGKVPCPADRNRDGALPPDTDGAPHLRIRNLGIERGGRWLVRGLNIDVGRGEFVAVVGPSGAGKSSLLACMAGMLDPTAGEVSYRCAQGCCHKPLDFRRRTGIIFQNFMLTPNNTVLANVLCGRVGRYSFLRTLFGYPFSDKQEAFAILDNLGLGPYLYRWAVETSGGEQQRTAIARALFQQPELFLADEPVSNLDAYLAGRVLGILRQEASLRRRTVFCVLHNPDLVDRFADKALSLDPVNPEGWRLRDLRG